MSTKSGDPLPPAEVLFGKTRRALLEVFLFRGHGHQFYLRELARLTGTSPGNVRRELETLCAAGIVVRQGSGRRVGYEVDEHASCYGPLRELLLAGVTTADLVRAALRPVRDHITSAFVYETGKHRFELVVVSTMPAQRVSDVLRRHLGARAEAVGVRAYLLPEIVSAAFDGDPDLNAILDRELTFVIGTGGLLATLLNRPVGTSRKVPDRARSDA